MLRLCPALKNANPNARRVDNMLKTWRPSKAILASLALHVGAVVALLAGLAWPWVAGVVLANHVGLTLAGLWARSTLLGANITRMPDPWREARCVGLTLDDGPNPQVTPEVLDVLDAFNAKASFFCPGHAIEAHPELAREIIRRGHSIENHSYGHKHHFSVMGLGTLRLDIEKAQNIILDVTGYQPKYFRAPVGLRSPLLDPVLQSLNLKLVSWTRRGFDTITNNPATVLARLERDLRAGDILLLHDGNSATTKEGKPVVLDVLPKLLDALHRAGLKAVALNYVPTKDPIPSTA
jgi:peptidoglycan-N-acetylglucosamine deacetylase